MDDFFTGFELRKESEKTELIKSYPQWVLGSVHPQLAAQFYEIVEQIFKECKSNINLDKFRKKSDALISLAMVCRKSSKHRNALQNHPHVVEHIKKRNAELEKLLAESKKHKSLRKRTKAQLKSECDNYSKQHIETSKAQLEALLKSELLVSQADALQQIAELKQQNSELRSEIAALKSANEEHQYGITTQRSFAKSSGEPRKR